MYPKAQYETNELAGTFLEKLVHWLYLQTLHRRGMLAAHCTWEQGELMV